MVTNPLAGQKIYLDSNSLIYSLENPTNYPGLVRCFIEPFLSGSLQVVTSWITLAEVLVKPLRARDDRMESYYRRILSPSSNLTILPVDRKMAVKAAEIRSETGLRLPDAIHISTGIQCGCDLYLTSDAGWSKANIAIINPNDLPWLEK